MKNILSSASVLWAFLLLFVGVQEGFAQKAKGNNTVLWKVEGDDIKTSYLMGTFHMLPKEDFVLKEKVKKAFEESEQVVLELDMDDPAMQGEMMKNLSLPDGKTIDKLLSKEEYERLDNRLKSINGQGLAPFNGFKPLLLTSIMTLSAMGEEVASFEGTFVQMASEQQKEVLGLETVAEQVQVFDRIPYESQLDDIMEMIDKPEESLAELNKLIALYQKEDIKALENLMDETLNSKEEKIIMLDERNQNWIPKIGELAADKRTFFGVGAGHLGGKKGVISLLRKAGYKVTPIKD